MFKFFGLIWFYIKFLDLYLYNINDKVGEILDLLYNMFGGYDWLLIWLIIRNMYVVIILYVFDLIVII